MELMWELVDIVEERAAKTDVWASKRGEFRDIQSSVSRSGFELAQKNFKLMQILLAEPFAFEENANDYFLEVETFSKNFDFRPEFVDDEFMRQIEFLSRFAEFSMDCGPPVLDSGILMSKIEEFNQRNAKSEGKSDEEAVETSDDDERVDFERRVADLRRDINAKNKESIETIKMEHFIHLENLQEKVNNIGGNKALSNTLERIAAKYCKLVSEAAATQDDPGLYLLAFQGLTHGTLERIKDAIPRARARLVVETKLADSHAKRKETRIASLEKLFRIDESILGDESPRLSSPTEELDGGQSEELDQSQELVAATGLVHLQSQHAAFPSEYTEVEPWVQTLRSKESLHAALSRTSKVGILSIWSSTLISVKLVLMELDSADTRQLGAKAFAAGFGTSPNSARQIFFNSCNKLFFIEGVKSCFVDGLGLHGKTLNAALDHVLNHLTLEALQDVRLRGEFMESLQSHLEMMCERKGVAWQGDKVRWSQTHRRSPSILKEITRIIGSQQLIE